MTEENNQFTQDVIASKYRAMIMEFHNINPALDLLEELIDWSDVTEKAPHFSISRQYDKTGAEFWSARLWINTTDNNRKICEIVFQGDDEELVGYLMCDLSEATQKIYRRT